VLEGTVTKVVAFGAFVEILPGVEGLVHISELADHHVENPSEVVEPGATLNVKILEIDEERRRLSLSIKRVEGQNMPMQGLGDQIQEAAADAETSDAEPAEETAETAESEAPAAQNETEESQNDEGGEHQEGESVADRPDSPDAVDEAAGEVDEAPDEVDEAAGDDGQTGESEQD
jgi:small subunit ribosomal protein S1